MHEAQIELYSTRFIIKGPPTLVALLSTIEHITDQEAKWNSYYQILSEWYVLSTSGNKITLDWLQYWNLDKNECYESAYDVPGNGTSAKLDVPVESDIL